MISPEIIRRYPFFGRLSMDQISKLTDNAVEKVVEQDHFFYHEEDQLGEFFLILEGAAAIVFELPERDVDHKISDQFLRKLKTKDVIISTLGPGDLFGLSGLIPPYLANAGAKALSPCRVIAFNSSELVKMFAENPEFGFIMTQKAAQTLSERLRDIRVESLSTYTE